MISHDRVVCNTFKGSNKKSLWVQLSEHDIYFNLSIYIQLIVANKNIYT